MLEACWKRAGERAGSVAGERAGSVAGERASSTE